MRGWLEDFSAETLPISDVEMHISASSRFSSIQRTLMTGVVVRTNESFEKALRRFTKTCEKTGIISDVKKGQYYEKPSEARKRQRERRPSQGREGKRRAQPGLAEMSVFLKLQEDVKDAMKAREQEKLLALRTLSSDIKKISIDAGRREPSDEDVLAAVGRALKQREDSADQFLKANRPELASVEQAQIAWIKAYQPEQLSEDEIRAIVAGVVAEVGATSKKDLGKVMGALMPKVKGKADGKLVQAAVQAALP
jgi:ribosomal protein S21